MTQWNWPKKENQIQSTTFSTFGIFQKVLDWRWKEENIPHVLHAVRNCLYLRRWLSGAQELLRCVEPNHNYSHHTWITKILLGFCAPSEFIKGNIWEFNNSLPTEVIFSFTYNPRSKQDLHKQKDCKLLKVQKVVSNF